MDFVMVKKSLKIILHWVCYNNFKKLKEIDLKLGTKSILSLELRHINTEKYLCNNKRSKN